MHSRGAPREQIGEPRVAKGTQIEPKGTPRDPKDPKMLPKAIPKASQRAFRNKRINIVDFDTPLERNLCILHPKVTQTNPEMSKGLIKDKQTQQKYDFPAK